MIRPGTAMNRDAWQPGICLSKSSNRDAGRGGRMDDSARRGQSTSAHTATPHRRLSVAACRVAVSRAWWSNLGTRDTIRAAMTSNRTRTGLHASPDRPRDRCDSSRLTIAMIRKRRVDSLAGDWPTSRSRQTTGWPANRRRRPFARRGLRAAFVRTIQDAMAQIARHLQGRCRITDPVHHLIVGGIPRLPALIATTPDRRAAVGAPVAASRIGIGWRPCVGTCRAPCQSRQTSRTSQTFRTTTSACSAGSRRRAFQTACCVSCCSAAIHGPVPNQVRQSRSAAHAAVCGGAPAALHCGPIRSK